MYIKRHGRLRREEARSEETASEPRSEGARGEDSRALPQASCVAIANELRLMEVNVSATGVRGVWTRHDLPRRSQRLLRLEGEANKETIALSVEQIRMLEEHSPEFRVRHIEANAPGELLNQDTFHWGVGGPVSMGFPVLARAGLCKWRGRAEQATTAPSRHILGSLCTRCLAHSLDLSRIFL